MRTVPPESNRQLEPEHWLDRHGDVLYRYAIVRLGSANDAEEVVQQTLVAALSAAKSYAGGSTERTWLVGILRHKVIDVIRARKRTITIGEEPEPGEAGCGPTEAWGARLGSADEEDEFRRVLWNCLKELPLSLIHI